MQRKRFLLSSFLLRTGLLRLANASGKSTLTIFGYHRIRPRHFHTWFDDRVFDAPHAEAFRKHLTWLKQYADPVSETDVLNAIWGRVPLPKRAFMITFDDGYRDNLKVAAPILKELNVPGLFFIPTEPITERCLGWWDLIAWCLKKTEKTEITFRGKTYLLNTDSAAADHELKQMMKLQSAYKNSDLINELANECAVELPNTEMVNQELLSWDEVRELKKMGMHIGSHTHSHRVLATLPLEEQKEELLISKQILEKELRTSIYSLGYPVGGYEHFNRETMTIAQDLGYEMAFSYLTGVNHVGSLEPFDIRRISAAQTQPELLASIALPRIFGHRRCALPEPRSARS